MHEKQKVFHEQSLTKQGTMYLQYTCRVIFDRILYTNIDVNCFNITRPASKRQTRK